MKAGVVIVALLSLSACKLESKPSCVSLCQNDEKCQQALAAEGIAPMGMTKSDPGLCRGICASLRTMAREDAKGDAPHPCMPATK
jgi:hypothetical protein